MARRRSDIVDAGNPGIYHCISRCVRRESLLDEPERRAWIVRRLQFLVDWMAVDVISFAVMRNHMHLLLAIRPEVVARWSDREVAERRVALMPNRRRRARLGVAADAPPTLDEMSAVLSSSTTIARARSELSNLGFFHRLLKEPCARLWNKQDQVTGHFWEGRFNSPRVLDLEGLMHVARYIELNEVHAGAASSVQASHWTSASVQWKRVMQAAVVAIECDAGTASPQAVAAQIAAQDWCPVFPCRSAHSAAAAVEPSGAHQREGGTSIDHWAGSALGVSQCMIRLVDHLESTAICGQIPRLEKRGHISLTTPSPVMSAIATALSIAHHHDGSQYLKRRTPPQEELQTELTDHARHITDLLTRCHTAAHVATHWADPLVLASSRGTCYGSPQAVAVEAQRRGRGRLWVGLTRDDPQAA